ncbi:hypothetical protein ACFFIF_10150 [Vagococcus entomophilus]|uniref:Uncharacterized protein n=1 Tax=Vagococcus entomophilus TaxID=1160095 RepID=A0A430AGB5_9ENTE|nr:hypothetical protein [Vagococcus entomophilus]RSU06894.1 hypothetical protein CBF30_06435 [Vagococcus entomophilus]
MSKKTQQLERQINELSKKIGALKYSKDYDTYENLVSQKNKFQKELSKQIELEQNFSAEAILEINTIQKKITKLDVELAQRINLKDPDRFYPMQEKRAALQTQLDRLMGNTTKQKIPLLEQLRRKHIALDAMIARDTNDLNHLITQKQTSTTALEKTKSLLEDLTVKHQNTLQTLTTKEVELNDQKNKRTKILAKTNIVSRFFSKRFGKLRVVTNQVKRIEKQKAALITDISNLKKNNSELQRTKTSLNEKITSLSDKITQTKWDIANAYSKKNKLEQKTASPSKTVSRKIEHTNRNEGVSLS